MNSYKIVGVYVLALYCMFVVGFFLLSKLKSRVMGVLSFLMLQFGS